MTLLQEMDDRRNDQRDRQQEQFAVKPASRTALEKLLIQCVLFMHWQSGATAGHGFSLLLATKPLRSLNDNERQDTLPRCPVSVSPLSGHFQAPRNEAPTVKVFSSAAIPARRNSLFVRTLRESRIELYFARPPPVPRTGIVVFPKPVRQPTKKPPDELQLRLEVNGSEKIPLPIITKEGVFLWKPL